eukprot:7169850-Pyramimonas_sp.AAC.2
MPSRTGGLEDDFLKEFSSFSKNTTEKKPESTFCKHPTTSSATSAPSSGRPHTSHTHVPLTSNAPTNVSISEYQKMRSAYQNAPHRVSGAQPATYDSSAAPKPSWHTTAVPQDSDSVSRTSHVLGSKAIETANDWCKEAASEKSVAEVTLRERERWVAEIEKLLIETELESKRRMKKAQELEEQLLSAKKATHESIQRVMTYTITTANTPTRFNPHTHAHIFLYSTFTVNTAYAEILEGIPEMEGPAMLSAFLPERLFEKDIFTRGAVRVGHAEL